jgi:hypothetical protein
MSELLDVVSIGDAKNTISTLMIPGIPLPGPPVEEGDCLPLLDLPLQRELDASHLLHVD